MKFNQASLLALLFCTSFAAHADKIRVYAASSMTNVVNELVDQFEAQSDVQVTTVYGGSSSLARQIAQGAPADVLISANLKWVDYLQDQGVVNGDNVTNVASNQLVVIAPSGNSAQLNVQSANSWLDALDGQRMAIGQTNAVPAGIYAKQSLTQLGVWPQVQSHLAPTNNVRIALTLVERKEAPLGIVYKTDAMLSKEVQIIAQLPDSSHSPIIYPMAIINRTPSSEQFAQFVQSPSAQQVMQRYGFTKVEN